MPRYVRNSLTLFRFCTISLLAILLLSPLLKTILQEVKDPQIIVLEDQSLSVTSGTSGSSYAEFQNRFHDMIGTMSSDHNVLHFRFGDEVRPLADTIGEPDKVSNISEALQYVHGLYNDQNLGAIILATDGLYNEGRNPIYQNLEFKAPVYTVGLGDTTAKRDLLIRNIYFNKIAYLGDKFTVQTDIQAINCSNARSQLTVFEEVNEQLVKIESQVFAIDTREFFTTLSITLEARQAGIVRYRLQLDPVPDEITRGNNIQDIYVEVLDGKQVIGIVANAPHPDISSMKNALEKNKNYEVAIHYAGDAEYQNKEFDFVIFHNLPSLNFPVGEYLNRLDLAKTPRMFLVGAQTDLGQFSRIQNTIDISGEIGQLNEVQAYPNERFNLFNLQEKTMQNLRNFVPLLAPFGQFGIGPNTSILLYQKIGNVETPFPLVCFSEELGIKTAVIVAEGIWKWQLFDYLQNDNNEIFQDFLGQSVTYTTVKEDKRKFRVNSQKNLYKENERVSFTAQLYNNSYQLINDPDVFLTIQNRSGNEFDFIFSKRNNIYDLDAGLLPNGTYGYEANVNWQGKQYDQSGRFTVQSIQLELSNLTADHQLLHRISEKHGGKFVYMTELDSLRYWLNGSDQLKPLVFSSTQTKSIIHLKWIFGLLFALLAAEWFLRRYFGSY